VAVQIAVGDAGVGVHAAVAEEGPVTADVLEAREVHAGDEDFFLVAGASGQLDAERVGMNEEPQNSMPGPPAGAS